MSGRPPFSSESRFPPSSTQDSSSECSEGCWHAQHHVRSTSVASTRRGNSRALCRCRPAEYRVWVKATADWYPVNSYLHQCQRVPSPHCPYCPGQEEALANFTTICPRFREVRTASSGHNLVRAKLASLLAKCLDSQWQLFEITSMRSMGLELQQGSAACMVEAGRLPPGDDFDSRLTWC